MIHNMEYTLNTPKKTSALKLVLIRINNSWTQNKENQQRGRCLEIGGYIN